jgi:teichoic acid transport system permease protein
VWLPAVAVDPGAEPMAVSSSDAHLRPLDTNRSAWDYLRQMWSRRDFIVAMPLEEVRSTHQNTLLGNVWHLGNPMLSVAVYYLVFGVILEANRGIDNYILWLMIGVFTFGLTQKTVLGGATSIAANQGLMRAIRFPRALLPVSVTISKLLTFGFELSVLAVVALVTGEGVSWRWLVLPVVLTLHSALNLGGAFFAARLNDAFRDVQQIIPFLFRLLIYVSGVMFPLEVYISGDNVPDYVRTMVNLNPLVVIIEAYRWVFLGTGVELDLLARAVTVSFLMLVAGFVYFRGAEHRYGRA